MGDLVRFSFTFSDFCGIQFFWRWVRNGQNGEHFTKLLLSIFNFSQKLIAFPIILQLCYETALHDHFNFLLLLITLVVCCNETDNHEFCLFFDYA